MVKFAFQANRARWGVDNGANEQGGGFIIAIQDGENATNHVLVQCISREALHLQASTPFAKYNVSHIHYWRRRTTYVIYLGVLTSWPIYSWQDAATSCQRHCCISFNRTTQPSERFDNPHIHKSITYVKRTRKSPLAEALCSTRGTCPPRRQSTCSRR